MPHDVAVLADRAVIAVEGPDARSFLQRLVTNDVEGLAGGEARYAALLTPQGKLTTDFLVMPMADEQGLLLDAPAATAAGLARALTLYRLRARVTVTDRSQSLGMVAFTGSPPAPVLVAFADPRSPALWHRAVVPAGAFADDAEAARRYTAARIRAGVPEGGVDFAYGEVFPHDANLDLIHGVDFTKGCYVGQEVVSRVQHRGTARKRVVPATFEGPAPAPGTEVMVDGLSIGTFGSAVDGEGLALVRVDRASAATGPVTAAATVLHLGAPAGR